MSQRTPLSRIHVAPESSNSPTVRRLGRPVGILPAAAAVPVPVPPVPPVPVPVLFSTMSPIDAVVIRPDVSVARAVIVCVPFARAAVFSE